MLFAMSGIPASVCVCVRPSSNLIMFFRSRLNYRACHFATRNGRQLMHACTSLRILHNVVLRITSQSEVRPPRLESSRLSRIGIYSTTNLRYSMEIGSVYPQIEIILITVEIDDVKWFRTNNMVQ
jgi:hypothetical protein